MQLVIRGRSREIESVKGLFGVKGGVVNEGIRKFKRVDFEVEVSLGIRVDIFFPLVDLTIKVAIIFSDLFVLNFSNVECRSSTFFELKSISDL